MKLNYKRRSSVGLHASPTKLLNEFLWNFVLGFYSKSQRVYSHLVFMSTADPTGGAVYGVSLRPLVCWDMGSNPAGGMDVCLLRVLRVVR
jgi:hypothetical protein